MKKLLAGFVALILLCSISFGDLHTILVWHNPAVFQDKDRVPNVEPGYCAWACLEMMCRQQGIENGYGLLVNRMRDPAAIYLGMEGDDDVKVLKNNWGTDIIVKAKLRLRRIPCKMNKHAGDYNDGIKMIKEANGKGRGALVGLMNDKYEGHAEIVVFINKYWVELIDPDDIITRTLWSREVFDEWWTRMVVVVGE